MSNPRIVVVGGGSQFAIGLCESFIDYARDALSGATVVLLDTKPDHLWAVHKFATRLASQLDVDMDFDVTIDRREAFAGADYLLTTFRPGSHDQQEMDERIPVKYGLQGNETVGIGGIFMACRVVPLLREICADAEELCPDAWIVNYTNPTQFVADAIQRISDMKVISLCDGYVGLVDDLEYFLDVPSGSVSVHPAGTNHAMWIMRLIVNGEDGYPLLRRRLDELSVQEIEAMFAAPRVINKLGIDYAYDEIYKQFISHYQFPFSLKLFEIYGLLAGPRYYWRYLLEQDTIIEAQRRDDYVTMAGFYTRYMGPRIFDELDQRLSKATLELESTRRAGGAGHGDLAVRMIASMIDDLDETFVVNVENKGTVTNLPDDAILELSAAVGRAGATPFPVGALPKELLGMQHSLVLSQQLAVDAALNGDRNDLLKAIIAHPVIHSVEAAEGCMDELLQLQADWLPQFHTASRAVARA
jgi:6-phospho-beta-glucosidase